MISTWILGTTRLPTHAILFTDNRTYADYLTEAFEMLTHVIPPARQIEELQKQARGRFDWLVHLEMMALIVP